MIFLRSLLFNAAFVAWSVLVTVVGLCVLPAPRSWTLAVGRWWAAGMVWLLRVCCGLSYEVRGSIPAPPAIVASKHQSTWDTLILPLLLRDPALVMKRELLFVPLLGVCLWRAGHIPVDRKGGAKALHRMIAEGRRAAGENRSIVIYPEGTRTPPGERVPYHPGVLALYAQLKLPIVPVALNSGMFWGRRQFVKRPGRIVVEFLDPLPPGAYRKELVPTLEACIETVSECLRQEALRSLPADGRPPD